MWYHLDSNTDNYMESKKNKNTIVEKSITPDKVTEIYDKTKEEVINNVLLRIESDKNSRLYWKAIILEQSHTRELVLRYSLNLNDRNILGEILLDRDEANSFLSARWRGNAWGDIWATDDYAMLVKKQIAESITLVLTKELMSGDSFGTVIEDLRSEKIVY
jgi:hypothetical protein